MAELSPYISAAISILVVMLLSMASIFLVWPLLNKSFSKHIISLLTMLAVGCLCGDAVFHLIPHSLGLHDRPDEICTNLTLPLKGRKNGGGKDIMIVWKCSLVIASIYMFYLLNNLMNYFNLGHGHSHGHSHTVPHLQLPIGGEDLQKNIDRYIETKFNNLKTENDGIESEAEYQQLLLNYDSLNTRPTPVRSNPASLRHIPRVVWMILIGGVLHNITDGLAVGASFAGSISGGISTTLAILFHEIPHEIGDFVILLNAGIRAKYAILLSIMTYVASLIGSFAGVALGKELDIVEWIFGATAGMFLYIALVELLPDTIDDADDVGPTHRSTFIWQNIGFLTGTIIMALIAAYEDRIKSIVGSY